MDSDFIGIHFVFFKINDYTPFYANSTHLLMFYLFLQKTKKDMNLHVFLQAKDVQRLFNCSIRTAQRKVQHYRIVKEKEKRHKIHIKEFCDYYDLSLEKSLQILGYMPFNANKRQ
jgi:hypothetical protein